MRQDFEQASDQRRIAYRYLDLEIDPGVPAITRAGQPIELRAKALTLLLFLVDQRHRIVSKEEIFERVWPNTAVMDATLAGCIQEIRRALADAAKDPHIIRTVPKLGYRFVAPLNEWIPSVVPSPGESPVEAMIPPAPARRWYSRWHSRWIAAAGMLAILAAAAILMLRRSTPVDDFREAAWWKFDEGGGTTITDSSGHQLTGTVLGGSWTSGVRGGALRFGLGFGGTGNRAAGFDTEQILPRQDMPRTLAAWVKTDTASGDINGILHFGDPAGPASFDAPQLMLLPDGRPAFANQGYAGFGGDHSLAVAEQGILDGRWHHLAGTLSGGRGVLYVDGAPRAVTNMRAVPKPAASMSPWARGTPWAIANYVNQTRSGFRGTLDDVRVWRRALRPSEVTALHRCTAGLTDLATPSRQYFFSPIFNSPEQVDIRDGQLLHQGLDYGGIQLAAQSEDCPVAGLRGADLGQDLSIAVELLVPLSSAGDIVQAGPYFRSRAAAPGDGILGGASAGYWVQLHSTGKVSVKCLNPVHTVALTQPVAGFDSRVFHRLEVVVRGEELEASLDGRALTFHQGDHTTRIVQVQPHWERPAQIGKNHGAVGIAFSSEPLRPKAGGQQARGFTVLPHPTGTAHR